MTSREFEQALPLLEIEQESVDTLPPPHPFILIDETGRYAFLEARKNGETIKVTRQIGRFALALEVGMEHEKTREEISRHLYPDDPTRIIAGTSFSRMLERVRVATKDFAPRIVTKQGNRITASTYYYEDVPPEGRAEDFEEWDDESTCIRFDTRTGYLVVARDGHRTGARLDGYIAKRLLEYLLRHPNETIRIHTLHEHLLEYGYDKGAESTGRNISSLKRFISHRLNLDPHTLLGTKISASRNGTVGLYTFHADRVEIVEADGSIHIMGEEHDSEETQMQPVDARDVAILALALSLKQRHIKNLRAMMPQIAFPNDQELAGLAAVNTVYDDYSAKQIVADNIDECLQRIKELFDSDDALETLQNWSPSDGNLKSFVLFLARFDRLRLSFNGEQVRGLDILRHIMLTI